MPLQSLPKGRYELRVDMHASNSHAAIRVGGQRLFAGDTPITIHWPDSSVDVVSITASYEQDEKGVAYDLVRVFKLNEVKFADDILTIHDLCLPSRYEMSCTAISLSRRHPLRGVW